MRELKQNTDNNVKLFLTDSTDHITGKTGLTLAVELCKDDEESFSAITSVASAGEVGNGWYNVKLTESNNHTDTIGDIIVRATATGADSAERLMNVVENIESDSISTLDSISGDIQDINLELDGLATESTLESISGDINTIKGTGYDTDQHSLTKIKQRIG